MERHQAEGRINKKTRSAQAIIKFYYELAAESSIPAYRRTFFEFFRKVFCVGGLADFAGREFGIFIADFDSGNRAELFAEAERNERKCRWRVE